MIPRHPSCRCAWIPANVGETTKGQKRSQGSVLGAVQKSMKLDSESSGWAPATSIGIERPKSVLNSDGLVNRLIEFELNAFCPTGAGGGVDPTCGKDHITPSHLPSNVPVKEQIAHIQHLAAEFESNHPGASASPEAHALMGKYFNTSRSWDINHLLRVGSKEGFMRQYIQTVETPEMYTAAKKANPYHQRQIPQTKEEAVKALKQGERDYKRVSGLVESVHQAFETTKTSSHGETVYRRVGSGVTKDLKVGDVFEEKGVLSTTLSHSHGRAQSGGQSVFVIKSAVGSKVVFHAKEAELLFQPGTQLRVRHIEGSKYYFVDMLPNHSKVRNT